MVLTSTEAPTSAASQAHGNWAKNRAALSRTQPVLANLMIEMPANLAWVFARDGSLTAMTSAGRWWADCSVPLLAGRALLESLEPGNFMSCYLMPAHAGLLRAARQRNGDEPALLAIVPDFDTLRVILACHDFSDEITSHRLWFATGEAWPEQVKQIFDDHPGLPTPVRFIRTKLTSDEITDAMIAEAQRVISTVIGDRNQQMEAIRSRPKEGVNSRQVLLIAGTRFRLWDDAGSVLQQALNGIAELSVQRFDSDNVATSSPLALAKVAADCGWIVAANVSRADAANVVTADTPWITWITRPQIPPFSAAGPRDALLLADPSWHVTAMQAGWPVERLVTAGWPAIGMPAMVSSCPLLAMLVDTQSIRIPASVENLSSHRVLWDFIEFELHDNPLLIGQDIGGYMNQRASRLEIAPDTIDHKRFIENLILPAYQHGLARLLVKAGVPLRIYGHGWDKLDEFQSIHQGPISTREDFTNAISSATVLIYPWPIRHAHPIHQLGKSVVCAAGGQRETFVREASLAQNKRPTPATKSDDCLAVALRQLLGI